MPEETFPKNAASLDFPAIAAELSSMAGIDQAMRGKAHEDDSWDDSVDARNTARMKEIVAQIGWPTVSKVGKEGAEQAWLLVQHADRDVGFQQLCLDLMKAEPETEVSRTDVAMLEDRVRVNSGRPQLYGTQFTQKGGAHVPRAIEDPDTVDERRASMGLGTLEEGIRSMYERYGTPKESE